MKSLVKAKSERGLWREETPRPAVGPNDVLIKVKKAAICGTDLHIYNWDKWAARTIPVPMVVGHEYLGVIEEIGRDVTALKVGQRVSPSPIMSRSPPPTPISFPIPCPTRSPPFSIRSATPCIPRCRSISSARTSSSPAPDRSA
jgi:threonine dehydrogenase-like Zn-dependent dehydrogenase